MQILIAASTKAEIQHFITSNPNIDVLITGIGVPSTLFHIQKRIHQMDYDLIIQAGIAGSFNLDLELGNPVLVKQDCFGDIGIEEKEIFTSFFETGFIDKNEFPFTNGWLVNENEIFNQSILPSVKAVTVNKVSDSNLQTQQLVKAFNPDIETMEGAALHYICLQESIPFIQIRALSNYVGERDKTKWKTMEAIENLNTTLQKLISQL